LCICVCVCVCVYVCVCVCVCVCVRGEERESVYIKMCVSSPSFGILLCAIFACTYVVKCCVRIYVYVCVYVCVCVCVCERESVCVSV